MPTSSASNSLRLASFIAIAMGMGSILLGPRTSQAAIVSLSDTLVHDTLSESVPTAFAPQGAMENTTLSDFSVSWVGPPIPGVTAELEPSSLQWVRVAEVLVLPRAMLRVHAQRISGGSVRSGNFIQPISPDVAVIPIALISGEPNPIDVSVVRDGRQLHGRLFVHYHSPQTDIPSIGVDSSCSRFGLTVEAPALPPDERIYVGCRQLVSRSAVYRTSTLELYVFWDRTNGKTDVLVNGAPAPSTRPGLWVLTLRPEPGEVELASASGRVVIRYSIPEKLHYASLGMGLGPYSYQYFDPAVSTSSVAPLLTVYGSYFFKESIRLIAFDAITMNEQWVTDLGLYVSSEYARVLDNRVTFHVMLGAHAIGFSSSKNYYLRLGAPQGLDVVYADAFGRDRDLSLGGFVFPSVNGTSYYNFWLRWGSPSVFVEMNYILWTEQVSEQTVFSRSIGLSLGFPVARFL